MIQMKNRGPWVLVNTRVRNTRKTRFGKLLIFLIGEPTKLVRLLVKPMELTHFLVSFFDGGGKSRENLQARGNDCEAAPGRGFDSQGKSAVVFF